MTRPGPDVAVSASPSSAAASPPAASMAPVVAREGLRSWAAALALVTAVFLAANHLLLRGLAVGLWDVDGQFFPFFTYVADHARAARFALWDPFSSGGLPVLGEPQIGVFSPVTVLAGLITGGGGNGFILYWLFVWWAGGLGMLLLARHLGAPAWVAAVVALGFLFSGAYTGNAQHTSWIIGFSALPFIFWRLDAALRSARIMPAIQAGALWGLSALSAYPGLVVLTGGAALLWTLGRWLLGFDAGESGPPAQPPTFRHTALSLAALVGVGTVVLSPAYFAFFHEGAGVHTRVGALARNVALANQLDPAALVSAVTPWVTSLRLRLGPVIFVSSDPSMTNIYAGLLIPVFAVLALLLTSHRRWSWFVLILALLGLATAMGQSLPFRGWLYDALPPLRYFRHSSIFRLYFVFFACVLAVCGGRELARGLRSGSEQVYRRAVATGGIVAAIAVVGLGWFVYDLWSRELLGRRNVVYGLGWLAMAGVLLATWRLSPARRTVVVPALLMALAAGDALATSIISRPTVMRAGAGLERWRDLDQRRVRELDVRAQELHRVASTCALPVDRCRLNDQMILKYQSFDTYTTQRHFAHGGMLRDSLLQATAVGTTRVWFSDRVAQLPTGVAAFQHFRDQAHALGVVPLVVHAREEMLQTGRADRARAAGLPSLAGLPALEPLVPEIVSYGSTRFAFSVEAPRAGWLLVADRWARSWHATVNGDDVAVQGGNFIFRAVPVPAGRSVVVFEYRPSTTLALVALSWGVLAAVTAAGVLVRRR